MEVSFRVRNAIKDMSSVMDQDGNQTKGLAGWFQRQVLLLPVVVIASYYIGRGMGDTLQLLYLLCGLYALQSMDLRGHRSVLSLLALMLVMFLVSVLYPEFSAESLKYWLLCVLSGLVVVFTLGSYPSREKQPDTRLLAWVPVALLFGFAGELGYFYFVLEDFRPAVQVNGMMLAALAPLVLLFRPSGKYPASLLYPLFFLLSLACLALADSRTELLMLMLGVALFWAVNGKKVVALLVIVPVLLAGTLFLDSYLFSMGGLESSGDTYQWLDQVSSRRLDIWRGALSHPPENILTGVGIHRSMEFLPEIDYVKHLHNLFIEIWFETGLLGLLAYLALLFALLSGLPRAYRLLEGNERKIYAVFFASGVAALIGGCLDKGYLHPLTRYYMLFCFTVLYVYHRRCADTAG